MAWLVCKSNFYGTRIATNELAGHKPEPSQSHLVNACPAEEFFLVVLYVSLTIFQLNRDGSSWVEPVLS